MKTKRRWLKSAITARVTKQVSMPWQHVNRSRTEAMAAADPGAARRIFAMTAC